MIERQRYYHMLSGVLREPAGNLRNFHQTSAKPRHRSRPDRTKLQGGQFFEDTAMHLYKWCKDQLKNDGHTTGLGPLTIDQA
jgi:hypothetical protein